MVLFVAAALICQLGEPTMRAVPKTIIAQSLETSAGLAQHGANLETVLKVLGPGAKAGKVRRLTAKNILAGGEWAAKAEYYRGQTGWPIGRSTRDTANKMDEQLDFSQELARLCELCDAQIVTLKIGKLEEVRVVLMGPVGAEVSLNLVCYGRERSKPANWRQDPAGTLSVATDEGGYLTFVSGVDSSIHLFK